MGKATGFLEFGRELPKKIDPAERIKNNKEFVLNQEFGKKINQQASRCMDCGVPFCHNGCPIGNIIPEFNDAVYRVQLGRGLEYSELDQQLPRVYRSSLPCTL